MRHCTEHKRHVAKCLPCVAAAMKAECDEVSVQVCVGPDWKPYTGICGRCGGAIEGTRRKWCCSGECTLEYAVNHFWGDARREAVRRARRWFIAVGRARQGDHPTTVTSCARWECEADYLDVEVNHIEPRRGQGYGNGCHHHQKNLEVLCHRHHLEETAKQRGWRVRVVEPERAETSQTVMSL